MRDFQRPNIISSKCIDNVPCRYDGARIHFSFIERLKPYVNLITVCPEVEIGLSTPREALRLVLDGDNEKLIFSRTGGDLTEKMDSFCDNFLNTLDTIPIHGAILKSRSPSCGTSNVKLYSGPGKSAGLTKKTVGKFAAKVKEKYNNIAIEDEGRLTNYSIREHFLTRIFIHADFTAVKNERKFSELIKFQSNNKYLLMAYSPVNLKKLGVITSNNKEKDLDTLLQEYEYYLLKALAITPNRMRNVNMLLHLFGYFKKELTKEEKAFFIDSLDNYSNLKVPFSVPLAIINSWAVRFNNDYLLNQTIFMSFPKDLSDVLDSGKSI